MMRTTQDHRHDHHHDHHHLLSAPVGRPALAAVEDDPNLPSPAFLAATMRVLQASLLLAGAVALCVVDASGGSGQSGRELGRNQGVVVWQCRVPALTGEGRDMRREVAHAEALIEAALAREEAGVREPAPGLAHDEIVSMERALVELARDPFALPRSRL